MDRIFLRDLCLPCIIGIHDWEREKPQTVRINLDLEVALQEAGEADDLHLSVDYEALRDRVEDLVSQSRYFTLEALAENIARICLAEPKVNAVRLWVEKPEILKHTRTVGIEIYRKKIRAE